MGLPPGITSLIIPFFYILIYDKWEQIHDSIIQAIQ